MNHFINGYAWEHKTYPNWCYKISKVLLLNNNSSIFGLGLGTALSVICVRYIVLSRAMSSKEPLFTKIT